MNPPVQQGFSAATSAAEHMEAGDSDFREKSACSPVYAWMENPSMVDFPGRCAAVLFTSGCNYRCAYCHNAELLEVLRAGVSWPVLEARLDRWAENWTRAAVVSGGEPLLHDTTPELLSRLRARGWAVKLDTNGSRTESLAVLLPQLDYVAMDVKGPLSEYRARTGGDPDAVAASARLLKEWGGSYELRTTIVAGWHDAEAVRAMGREHAGAARWVLQPYVARASVPDAVLRKAARTTPRQLRELAECLKPFAREVVLRGA